MWPAPDIKALYFRDVNLLSNDPEFGGSIGIQFAILFVAEIARFEATIWLF